MGTSTDAVLAYGYDLGSEEDWLVHEADQGRLPNLDWRNPDHHDDADFVTAVENTLLVKVAGFTETDRRADGYFTRERAAHAKVGVEIVSHCSDGCEMYVLSAHTIRCRRGHLVDINPDMLARVPDEFDYHRKLAAALTALGLTPKQEQPQWLLCSWWCS